MEQFLTRHGDRIAGILSGFDRMIFRGTLRSISYPAGLEAFLATRRVLLKEFGPFAQRVTDRVKQHAESLAQTAGRPFVYLAWARRVMPWLDRRSGWDLRRYYWSQRQSEYATDVVFQRGADLATIYPRLTHHAIEAFHAPDVLRFLGRRFGHRSNGEVTTTFKRRAEGVCVRHSVEANSLKMYDKAGCLLRVETTINDPTRFRLRRRVTRHGRRRTRWVSLRKGSATSPGAWNCRAPRMRAI